MVSFLTCRARPMPSAGDPPSVWYRGDHAGAARGRPLASRAAAM